MPPPLRSRLALPLALVTLLAAVNNLARAAATAAATAAAAVQAEAHTQHDAAHAAAGEKPLFPWWELLAHGRGGAAWSLIDPRWWAAYIAAEFRAEPAHATIETVCILMIAYLLVIRKPAPMQQEKLSKKEEDELIAEWKPEPLCPKWQPPTKTRYVVESAAGRTVVANGRVYLNFASTNFLGLADRAETKAACRATIEKYGVGSCGPRGFYGTFDLHLAIESALASFLGAEETILYSDSIACVSSVIPAFAKKGDVIVVDDSVSFGIQQGCLLSRSTIHYFRHGDMASLESTLQAVDSAAAKTQGGKKKQGKLGGAPTHRRFLVLEGVSSIDGSIAPLSRVLALKSQYGYRLILDDSLGFGVLGERGRGTMEHFGAGMQQAGGAAVEPGVDILVGTLDGSLASVGGFCAGNHQVVDHQRLSGAGYCFSASSPPYTSTASLQSLSVLQSQPALCSSLRKKAAKLRRALAQASSELVVLGGAQSEESPVIHLARRHSSPEKVASERVWFESLLAHVRDASSIILSVPEFIPADRTKAQPSLRINLTQLHTEADMEKLVKAVAQAVQAVKRI